MRKLKGLKVVLLVVGLLTVAAVPPPAMAQLADPISLAASGVLLPFFSDSAAGFISVLEVASPTVPILNITLDGPVLNPNNSIHMVFFNQTCAQDGSFPDFLTPKQAKMYVSTATPNWPNQNGLVAIAKSFNGLDLDPLDYPIWTRVHWLDTKTGRLRELEPITLDTFDHLTAGPFEAGQVDSSVGSPNPGMVWNPLRTAASFMTVQESTSVAATLYLICPRSTIQSAPAGAAGVFPATKFPALLNRGGIIGFPAAQVVTGNAVTAVRGRIYDDDETGPFDIVVPCDCLTVAPLKPISTIYSGAPRVLNNYTVPSWYTELESRNVNPNPVIAGSAQFFAFTGYWGLEVLGTPIFPSTLFHRLSNASLDNISPALGGIAAPVPTNNR